MVAIENPKFNGAELIAELVKTGTGDEHLVSARDVLAFVHRAEARVATANEIIEALESAGVTDAMLKYARAPKLTIQKARALAETGVWNGVEAVKVLTVEEKILAGQKLPEESPRSALEKMADAYNPGEACEEKAPLGLKPAPKAKKVAKSDRPQMADAA